MFAAGTPQPLCTESHTLTTDPFPFWHSTGSLAFHVHTIQQAGHCHDLAHCPGALLASGSSLENKLKCHVALSLVLSVRRPLNAPDRKKKAGTRRLACQGNRLHTECIHGLPLFCPFSSRVRDAHLKHGTIEAALTDKASQISLG